MVYGMNPSRYERDRYNYEYNNGMVNRDSSDWYERERIEREMFEERSRREHERRHAADQAAQAEALRQRRRSELEREISRLTGELFDVTHARADRTQGRSAAILGRTVALKDSSVKGLEAALHSITGSDGTAGTECADAAYARQVIGWGPVLISTGSAVVSGSVSTGNTASITFPAFVTQQTIAEWSIYDASSGGNRYYHKAITAASWHGGEQCPLCGTKLRDRKRSVDDGAFVGCGKWPDCGFAWSPMWGATIPCRGDEFGKTVTVMAGVYDAACVWRLAREACVDLPGELTTNDPHAAWTEVLKAADACGRVKKLFDIALIEYPAARTVQGRRMVAAWQSWKHGRVEAEPLRAVEKKMPAIKSDPMKIATDANLHALCCTLADLFTMGEAATLCRSAGLDSSTGVRMADTRICRDDVTWTPTADGWRQLLEQAQRQNRLSQLRCALLESISPDSRKKIFLRESDSRKKKLFEQWATWNESNKCTDAAPVGMVVEKDKVEDNMMIDKSNRKSTIDTIVDTVVSTTKEDSVDAAWLTAADEALEIGKPVAKQILKEFAGSGPMGKKVLSAIDSPIGEGAVAWTMGWAIMGYGPLRGNALGAKTLRLSKALRVRGLKPVTDMLAKRFIRPMSKRLTTLIEGLPALVGEG